MSFQYIISFRFYVAIYTRKIHQEKDLENESNLIKILLDRGDYFVSYGTIRISHLLSIDNNDCYVSVLFFLLSPLKSK